VYASITDHFVTIATHFIRDVGLPGTFVLMAAAAAAIPFPSEATMLFSGFNVYDGHQTMLGITVAGVAGDAFGCTVAYLVGYYGRVGVLERHGTKLHVTPERLDRVERFFARRGNVAVCVGRVIPVVRALVSFPAGSAKMPYPRFLALCIVGATPYVLGLGLLGKGVGSNWEQWRKHLGYVDYAAAIGIVAGAVYLIARSRVRRTPDEETTGPA
jgi:membrane protein DedA with SNARE-associated domain